MRKISRSARLKRPQRDQHPRPVTITEEQLKQLHDGRLALSQVELSAGARFKAIAKMAFTRIMDAEIGPQSAALAYYALLSLFPMLITFGNLLPLFGFSYDGITRYLGEIIPPPVMGVIDPVIENLLNSTGGWTLSIGTLLTLWTASLAISGLKDGFNKAYGVKPQQNFFVQRILSIFLFFFLIVGLMVIMLSFTFGRQLLEWLVAQTHLSRAWLDTFNTWRWPVTLTALIAVIFFIDYFLPNVRIKFRTVIPGSIFTIAAWLVLAQAFSLYVGYFGGRFNSYGALGTFIVLLLWLNFSAMMWLIGAVINALVAEYFNGRPKKTRGKIRDFFRRLRIKKKFDL